jgi:long-chain acyl-CoA synthetase
MIKDYQSILEALKNYSETTPDKLCVCDKKNKITYKQFWQMLNKGAAYLEENGVKKGNVVVFRGAQKVEFSFALFSIQLLGAVACPLEKAVKE